MKEWINKDEVIDLLKWAYEQRHIKEDAMYLLIQNLNEVETKTEE